MKVSKYFEIEELVPIQVFKMKGINALRYIDKPMLDLLDAIRDYFCCAIVINDKYRGGTYDASGLRVLGQVDFKQWSDHSAGRAMDIKIAGIDSAEVQKRIKDNKVMFMNKGLTGIETDTNGWTHISTANYGSNMLALIPANGEITFI